MMKKIVRTLSTFALFVVAATLLLSCGLGVFYWIVVRHAFEEDSAVLADKVLAVSADLKNASGLSDATCKPCVGF